MTVRGLTTWMGLILLVCVGGPSCSSSSGADAGSDAPVTSDGADAPAPDAPGDGVGDGGACPGFAANTKDCSDTCYANCYGINASGVADPSILIGDCFFTRPGNIQVYCTPVGITDPCSHCK